MSEETNSHGMRVFSLIWVGQLVSLLGSSMTSFALGLWALKQTSSVTQFALIVVLAGLPGILIAPFAGALVDRWDRKKVMLGADLGSALVVLTYAALLYTGNLQVWHIYIGAFVTSICGTFQWPAYIAAITMLIDRSQYGRVNGMLEFGQAGATIAAPALGGLLLGLVNIWGVLIVDFATFLFAVTTLLFAKIPKPEVSEEGRRARGSLLQEAKFGWTFIRERPGLRNLLFFFAAYNLAVCAAGTALQPMVRLFTNSDALVGVIQSLVGIGLLLGGAIMTATGGFQRKVHGVLSMAFLIGICLIVIGIRPSVILVGIGVVIWYMAHPIMNASSQAIWMAKTPQDVQGRVFATRRMIAQFTTPIGDFSAGPLSDKIFLPLLMPGGALADTAIGRLVGVGPGRGMGFMMMLLALVPMLAAVIAFLNPRVRNVEDEIPDAPKKGAPAPPPKEEDAAAEGEPATA
jgi:MFS transporter, DHA3 family, macrolide efflux protein